MLGKPIDLIRPQRIVRDLVVVDGMAHSGKQLVAQLLSTIKKGEMSLYNQEVETLCIAQAFGKIKMDAVRAIMSLSADVDLYNLMISRYTNFRKTDATGAMLNLVSDRQKKRLAMPDGDVVIKRIRQEKPILSYMTHHIFGVSQPIFETFDERLKLFIVCVRHPLWVIELWGQKRWRDRIGRDPREFQICCTDGRSVAPWFAGKWMPDYLKLKPLEQAIRTVDVFHKSYRSRLKGMSACDQKKIQFVPFEIFVSDPWPFIRSFSRFFKSGVTELSRRMAKEFSFPRSRLSEREINDQYIKIEQLMRAEGTPSSAQKNLEKMCRNYSQYLKTQDERTTIFR